MSNETKMEEIVERQTKNTIGYYKNIENIEEVPIDILRAMYKDVLADRERLQEDYKILEQNYEMLSENISNIAKKLNLQEDAIIDEIHTAISVLKSKRINMFEQLECIDKVNKYDSLINKMKDKKAELENQSGGNVFHIQQTLNAEIRLLQELLDLENNV